MMNDKKIIHIEDLGLTGKDVEAFGKRFLENIDELAEIDDMGQTSVENKKIIKELTVETRIWDIDDTYQVVPEIQVYFPKGTKVRVTIERL